MWIKRENEIECLVRQVHRWNIRPYYWKSYGGFIRFPLYRWVSRRNLSRLLASWTAQLSVPFSCLFGVHLSLVTIVHTNLVQSSTYPPVLCCSVVDNPWQRNTNVWGSIPLWRFGFSFDSNSWENVLNLPSMLQYFDTYWRKNIFSKFFIEACLSKEGICLRPQPLFVATPFVFFKLLGIFHFRLLGLDGPRSFCSHWSGVIFRWCIKTDHVLNSDYGECVILVAGSISSVRGAINLG